MEMLKTVNGEEVVVKISGRLDTVTAPQLEEYIAENLAGVRALTLDCEGLEYVSSAGLRVLLAMQKRMKDGLTLKNVCELVMEVFEMTGFADILTIA